MRSLFLPFLLLLSGATSLVHALATTPTSVFLRKLQEFNQDLAPPTRECGEVIGYTSLEDVQAFASTLIDGLLGTNEQTAPFVDIAKQFLVAVAKYGVVAQVVCTSCDEILEMYSGADFIDGDFSKLCNTDMDGGNVMTSSLLVYPVDADQQPIQGKLKTFTHMHVFLSSKQGSPSETFPADLLATVSSVPVEEVPLAILGFYDSITPAIAASSGTVAIAPDYMGYAQSYEENRLTFQLDNYKREAATHWLKASKVIEDLSGGCQVLDPTTATTAGYSEGGAASYAAAKALEMIGVDVKQISMGAPLLNAPASVTWGYNELKTNPEALQFGLVPILNAVFADSFSSVNPDLPNSGAGQDALSPAFQDSSSFLTDTNAWLQSEQSFESFARLVLTATQNDPTILLNPNLVAAMDTAIAGGSFEACENAVEGETDLLCQAISAQNLLDMVNAESSIRLDVCHSPDDDVVPEEINRPDYDNPNIFKFSLQIIEASGRHLEATYVCLIAMIVPFTGGAVDTNSVEPLDDPSTCVPPEGTSVAPSTTTMSAAPSAMGMSAAPSATTMSAAPSAMGMSAAPSAIAMSAAPSTGTAPMPTTSSASPSAAQSEVTTPPPTDGTTAPAPTGSPTSSASGLSVWILGFLSISLTVHSSLLY